MNTYALKTTKSKNQLIADRNATTKNAGTLGFHFIDNRSTTVTQRKLQEATNKSTLLKSSPIQRVKNNLYKPSTSIPSNGTPVIQRGEIMNENGLITKDDVVRYLSPKVLNPSHRKAIITEWNSENPSDPITQSPPKPARKKRSQQNGSDNESDEAEHIMSFSAKEKTSRKPSAPLPSSITTEFDLSTEKEVPAFSIKHTPKDEGKKKKRKRKKSEESAFGISSAPPSSTNEFDTSTEEGMAAYFAKYSTSEAPKKKKAKRNKKESVSDKYPIGSQYNGPLKTFGKSHLPESKKKKKSHTYKRRASITTVFSDSEYTEAKKLIKDKHNWVVIKHKLGGDIIIEHKIKKLILGVHPDGTAYPIDN